MSSGELTEWAAFERVYGPVLVHDRIDIGLAQVCLVLARLFSKKSKHTLRDFLPAWWQGLIGKAGRAESSIRQGFEALMRMADESPLGQEGGAKPTRGDG